MDLQTVYEYTDKWIAHCAENKGHSSSHFIDDNIEDSYVIESAVIKLLEEHELILFQSENRKKSVVVLTINGYNAHNTRGGIKEYIKQKKRNNQIKEDIKETRKSIFSNLGKYIFLGFIILFSTISTCNWIRCKEDKKHNPKEPQSEKKVYAQF